MSCVDASFEPVQKRQYDGALLADRSLVEVPVVLVKGESISLSGAKRNVRQFLAAVYPADLEKSPVPAPEEGASIHVLSGDVEGEASRDLADLTRGPDLGRQIIIGSDYGHISEALSG